MAKTFDRFEIVDAMIADFDFSLNLKSRAALYSADCSAAPDKNINGMKNNQIGISNSKYTIVMEANVTAAHAMAMKKVKFNI